MTTINEEDGGTAPNVTAGVAGKETAKMPPERRKELSDTLRAATKERAGSILVKVGAMPKAAQ